MSNIFIKKYILGPIQTNCYLVFDKIKKAGLIIDQAVFAPEILDFVRDNHLKIEYILLTHAHFDHVGGAAAMAKGLGAKVCLHPDDLGQLKKFLGGHSLFFGIKLETFQPDILLADGQKFKVGDLEFKVIHTPGHSPGGVSFYFKKENILFSGDTLFAGSYGRTDLPGGNQEKIFESIKKLLELPPETKVYPGHGEETVIKDERKDF